MYPLLFHVQSLLLTKAAFTMQGGPNSRKVTAMKKSNCQEQYHPGSEITILGLVMADVAGLESSTRIC